MVYIGFGLDTLSKEVKYEDINTNLLFLNILIFKSAIRCDFSICQRTDENFNRIFVPGTMPDGTSNDWGPNSNGVISPSAPSQMLYNENNDSYEKSYSLQIGEEYLYKLHFHYNASGGDYAWVSDPMNPQTTSDGWDNSILYVTDPLFFQPARHLNDDGMVNGLSLGSILMLKLIL